MHHYNVFHGPNSWLVESDILTDFTSLPTNELLVPWRNVRRHCNDAYFYNLPPVILAYFIGFVFLEHIFRRHCSFYDKRFYFYTVFPFHIRHIFHIRTESSLLYYADIKAKKCFSFPLFDQSCSTSVSIQCEKACELKLMSKQTISLLFKNETFNNDFCLFTFWFFKQGKVFLITP